MKTNFGKRLMIALFLGSILCSFTSCGASSDTVKEADIAEAEYEDSSVEEIDLKTTRYGMGIDLLTDEVGESEDEETGLLQTNAGQIDTEKIIRTANVEIETVEFTEAVETINRLAEEYNGYFDSTSIGGRSYEEVSYGYQTYRDASFSLRVPRENFSAITDALADAGNILNVTTTAENVTGQYTDTESRLKTYRTEEERLLSMLEKAETVEDMLNIEDRLADVRYEIESLTADLNQLDNKIYYCTVYITLHEVRRYTEVEKVEVGYWEAMGTGFISSLKAVGRFFADAAQWLVINLPVLLTIVIVVSFGIFLVIKTGKRKREKRAKKVKEE